MQQVPLARICYPNFRHITPMNQLPTFPTNIQSGSYSIFQGWNNFGNYHPSPANNSRITDKAPPLLHSQTKPLTAILFSKTEHLPYEVTASVLPSLNECYQMPKVVQKMKTCSINSPLKAPKVMEFHASDSLQPKISEQCWQDELFIRKSIASKGGARLFQQSINALSKQAKVGCFYI